MEQTEKDRRRQRFNRSKKYKNKQKQSYTLKKEKDNVFWQDYKEKSNGISDS